MSFQELGNNDFAPFKGDSPVAAKMILERGVEVNVPLYTTESEPPKN